MASITKKDYDNIQNNIPIKLSFVHNCKNPKHSHIQFNIEPNDIFCYGDIDFNDESEDLETLNNFNWLDDKLNGVHVPIDYDYNTHTCLSPISRYRTNECRNCGTYCQYIHGFLGKPKYICIFKKFI